jgi:hypothetical protein
MKRIAVYTLMVFVTLGLVSACIHERVERETVTQAPTIVRPAPVVVQPAPVIVQPSVTWWMPW